MCGSSVVSELIVYIWLTYYILIDQLLFILIFEFDLWFD